MEHINKTQWYYYKEIIPPLIDLFYYLYGDLPQCNLPLEKELLTRFLIRESTRHELAEEKGISKERVSQRIKKATRRISNKCDLIKKDIENKKEEAKKLTQSEYQRDAILSSFKLLASQIESLSKYTKLESFNNDAFLEDCDLSVRTYNCLRLARCKTVAQVSVIPISVMKGWRNIGKRSIDEIRELLLIYGYTPIE